MTATATRAYRQLTEMASASGTDWVLGPTRSHALLRIVTRPSCRAVFRELDAVAVLTARLLPAPLTLGPGWLCP
jgi:hypothetical protein